MSQPTQDPLRSFLDEALYRGPVYRKLDRLRRTRPELAPELDELARALREFAERIPRALVAPPR